MCIRDSPVHCAENTGLHTPRPRCLSQCAPSQIEFPPRPPRASSPAPDSGIRPFPVHKMPFLTPPLPANVCGSRRRREKRDVYKRQVLKQPVQGHHPGQHRTQQQNFVFSFLPPGLLHRRGPFCAAAPFFQYRFSIGYPGRPFQTKPMGKL